MHTKHSRIRWVVTGGLLFGLLFFHEKLGINLVLFDLFILTAIFLLYAEARQNAAVWWLAMGHLISLAMLMMHNTVLSGFSTVITLVLAVIYAMYLHRSPLYAGVSGMINFVISPYLFIKELLQPAAGKPRRRYKISRIIRFALLPAALVFFFFIVYSTGNSALNEYAIKIERAIDWLIGLLPDYIQWERLLLMVAGMFICSALLLRLSAAWIARKDLERKDDLFRKRESWARKSHKPMYNLIETFMGKMATGMMALKNENTIGLISLLLLNVLLLVVNYLDINYLWFSWDPAKEAVLYKMLHEGTGILIFSIMMAMLVLLFFFKGNLNFYQKNKWLKLAAWCWVLQNIVLVFSVFLRDYYYVQRYGLSHKRIGILFFLLMVLIGLLTVVIKIQKKKTIYFLFRVNGIAAIVVLVMASTIHWDELIAGYNLSRKDKVAPDIPYLLTLSDKTIPLLEKNIALLQKFQDQAPPREYRDFYSAGACHTCYVDQLKDREKRFLKKQTTYSWLSWNFADDYVKRYLTYLP